MEKSPKSEDDVKKDVRDYLSRRENEYPPTILWWERLNSSGKGSIETKYGGFIKLCREGSSDFIVLFVGRNKNIICIFIETKSPKEKPEPRKGAQTEFKDKYHLRHIDMHYMIAQSWQQVSSMINTLSHHPINEIEL